MGCGCSTGRQIGQQVQTSIHKHYKILPSTPQISPGLEPRTHTLAAREGNSENLTQKLTGKLCARTCGISPSIGGRAMGCGCSRAVRLASSVIGTCSKQAHPYSKDNQPIVDQALCLDSIWQCCSRAVRFASSRQSINQCYTCSYEAQKAHASHSLISRR
jgi:hypothetical protein